MPTCPRPAAYTLNSIAAVVIGGTALTGGSGGAFGSLVGALVLRAISFNFRIFDVPPLLQPLFEGLVLLAAVSLGAGRVFRVTQPPAADGLTPMLKLAADDRPIVIASLFVLVILALGSAYTLATQGNLAFLNPVYLLQQLQVGAFLGIVAAGMMLVILLGHIDLSVPWTLAAAAMMATAVGGAAGDPGGPRHRPRRRHLQRHRRRLPARAVDDLHPRRQRHDARPDGDAHRRLRAADRRHRRS